MGEPESLPPLNSLDCWDYSIELECLQGNQGACLCGKSFSINTLEAMNF